MENTGKTLKNVLAAALLALFVLLNVYGRTAEAGTLAGIRFCVTVIAPSLFIYIVLAKLILGSAAAGWFAKPSQSLFLLLLGFLCGFPTGAVLARELYDRGGVSAKRASYICAYANNPSLSFVLGFAGERAFPGSGAGWKFSLLIVLSSLLNMLVLRLVFFTAEERAELAKPLALGGGKPKTLVAAERQRRNAAQRAGGAVRPVGGAGERYSGIFRRHQPVRRSAGRRRTRPRRGAAGLVGHLRPNAGARGRGRAAVGRDVHLRARAAGGGDGAGRVFPLPLTRLDKRRIFWYT